MRFLVTVEPSWEGGERLDSQPGGPGPFFAAIGDRFRPEAFWTDTTRRRAWWVITFADAAAITEFTHLAMHHASAHPEYVPILTAEEAPATIAAAAARARGAASA